MLLLLAGSLLGADPAAKPFLRIEAGMHTAPIKRIATDAAGRVALTCSEDKTAKLWSLEKGKEGTLLRTFRCSIGEGKEGMLYACALSPDGKLAAVGGCATQDRDDSAAHHIYLFNTATGQLTARWSSDLGRVFDLAFSGSGRYLAAGAAAARDCLPGRQAAAV